jgi:hypothetical protein
VRRQVALKLIQAEMSDSATVQRYKAERQSLAIICHTAIAMLFDARTTPAGQPYLVMEYVDGLPIYDYCEIETAQHPWGRRLAGGRESCGWRRQSRHVPTGADVL